MNNTWFIHQTEPRIVQYQFANFPLCLFLNLYTNKTV